MSRTRHEPTAEEKAIEQAYDDAMAAAGRVYRDAEAAAEKAYRVAAKKGWDARAEALASVGEVPDAG